MGCSNAFVRRVSLLGADVDLVTREGVMEFVAAAAEAGCRAIVGNHNLHSLYLSRRDRRMASFFDQADLIEIDSMPMVYWARVLGLPTSQENRCTYLDWRDQFWAMASERGWRVFLLGGAEGVPEEAASRLAKAWPGVRFETQHGYFDTTRGGAENQAVIDAINAFEPHVVMVGMGMPIQEMWVAQNAAAIGRGVLLTVGAAIDYEAGVQGAAPRFLSGLCLEWLYRLALQPRRLSSRYLIEPWSLLGVAMADLEAYLLKPRKVRSQWRPFRVWSAPESEASSAESLSRAA
jgi:N-acetylglucosaminyldiphosphoundecaprenol N-acetyl-beta-D-mannosaminyltransferase